MKWHLACTMASGVAFEGTREEAQEHLNRYVAHLEALYKDRGLVAFRQNYAIEQVNGESEQDGRLL
jgi:hypothetical protein